MMDIDLTPQGHPMSFSIDHVFICPSSFESAVNFYQNALGFTVEHAWGEPGSPRGASLILGNARVVLAERHGDSQGDNEERGFTGTRPTIHIKCNSIQMVADRLKENGARLIVEPQATHWGVTWLVAEDPDRNLIAFFQEQGQS